MRDIGDQIVVTCTVTDAAGQLTDATVAATLTTPDDTQLPLTVVHASTGKYSAGHIATVPGTYFVTWQVTGAVTGSWRDAFTVAGRAPVLGLGEAKKHLNITTTKHDEELRGLIAVAERKGEQHTGRVFGRLTLTETHDGHGTTHLLLHRLPVLVVASVHIDGEPLASDEWTVNERVGAVTRLSGAWPPGPGRIEVTYTAGYREQPATDMQGIKEMLRHLWQTQRGTFRPHTSEDGWDPGEGYSLPNRVKELWDSDRTPGFA